MDIQIINKGLLALFFLYFVMIGGVISSLLNCSLQRFIKKSLLLKHILVFLSIFIFTFILNWYTPYSLVIEKMNNKDDFQKFNYIKNSLYYTIFIYILFIISSKQQEYFMYSFLILLTFIIGVFIYYLIEINSLKIDRYKLKNFFIKKEYLQKLSEKGSNINTLYILHNLKSFLYIILFINLIFGVYFYALKQMKDKKNNFNIILFIFGSHSCRE